MEIYVFLSLSLSFLLPDLSLSPLSPLSLSKTTEKDTNLEVLASESREDFCTEKRWEKENGFARGKKKKKKKKKALGSSTTHQGQQSCESMQQQNFQQQQQKHTHTHTHTHNTNQLPENPYGLDDG
jgi:hypothetical protein